MEFQIPVGKALLRQAKETQDADMARELVSWAIVGRYSSPIAASTKSATRAPETDAVFTAGRFGVRRWCGDGR